MHYVRAFFQFWYNFIIGDDWTIAALVFVGVFFTYWLAQQNIQAWWILPVVAIGALALSIWRATRTS